MSRAQQISSPQIEDRTSSEMDREWERDEPELPHEVVRDNFQEFNEHVSRDKTLNDFASEYDVSVDEIRHFLEKEFDPATQDQRHRPPSALSEGVPIMSSQDSPIKFQQSDLRRHHDTSQKIREEILAYGAVTTIASLGLLMMGILGWFSGVISGQIAAVGTLILLTVAALSFGITLSLYVKD